MTPRNATIVDYDCGNLASLERALLHVGVPAVRYARHAGEIEASDCLLLPGVGAFPKAMESLASLDLIDAIQTYAASGRPVLGICLGMQLLFETGEEFEMTSGLGLIPGRVRRLSPGLAAGAPIKVPHIGWAELSPSMRDTAGSYYYFNHSYVAEPAEPRFCRATAEYGNVAFCAVAQAGAVMGFQFHPEKSAEAGLALLRSYVSAEPIPTELSRE